MPEPKSRHETNSARTRSGKKLKVFTRALALQLAPKARQRGKSRQHPARSESRNLKMSSRHPRIQIILTDYVEDYTSKLLAAVSRLQAASRPVLHAMACRSKCWQRRTHPQASPSRLCRALSPVKCGCFVPQCRLLQATPKGLPNLGLQTATLLIVSPPTSLLWAVSG